tara:strand:+ start:2465 stop:2959 length:495 start_codon:yes stop_codon:yes gene_type:complete
MKTKNKNLNKSTFRTQEELEEELVHKHYGLVVFQALSFLESSHFDDYIQAGLIGLLKAIRGHDESKSKFSTFATVCIRNSISKLRSKIKKNEQRLVAQVDRLYSTQDNILDCLPEYLSEEDLFIIKLKIQNYTNSEIASYTSSSKEEVKVKTRAIIKLLKEVNK